MMPLYVIKNEIDRLNEELERTIKRHQFTLNMETKNIYERINQIQSECPHEFKEGVCVYCGKVEEIPSEDETQDDSAQEDVE